MVARVRCVTGAGSACLVAYTGAYTGISPELTTRRAGHVPNGHKASLPRTSYDSTLARRVSGEAETLLKWAGSSWPHPCDDGMPQAVLERASGRPHFCSGDAQRQMRCNRFAGLGTSAVTRRPHHSHVVGKVRAISLVCGQHRPGQLDRLGYRPEVIVWLGKDDQP